MLAYHLSSLADRQIRMRISLLSQALDIIASQTGKKRKQGVFFIRSEIVEAQYVRLGLVRLNLLGRSAQ